MPTVTAAAALPLQLEALNEYIPEIVEDEAELSKLLGDGGQRAVRVSTKAFRVRMKTALPGNVQKVNLDTGTLPSGGGTTWDQGTLSPLAYMLPIQYSRLADLTGEPGDVSSTNPVSSTIADVARQAAKYRDIFLQTDGTGTLGTVTAQGGGVITLAATPFGARLLNKGQLVQVMSSAFALRGTCTITGVFSFLGGTQTISVDAIPGGTVATDLIVVAGAEASTPIFINGIPAVTNSTQAGSYLGIARTNPYVVGNAVNAGSAQVTLPVIRTALNQIKQRLGAKALKGQFIHLHPSQRQAYEELGFQLQFVPLDAGKAKSWDGLFSEFTIEGRPVYENIHADQTRIDILLKKAWGQVKWGNPPFWFKNRAGQMVFQQYDTTSGNPNVNELMFMTECYQWFVDNVASQGAITSLKVPNLN